MSLFRHNPLMQAARIACLVPLALAASLAVVRAQAPAPPPTPPFLQQFPTQQNQQAQQPQQQQRRAVPGAGILQGEVGYRIQFVLIDQLSYQVHPFYQITEDPGYAKGKAASAFIFKVGQRRTDEQANVLEKMIHALPPFGFEGVMTMEWPLVIPRGIGIGFDFSPLSQVDTAAARGVSTVTAIEMDTYYSSAALRFYVFDPNQPGVNYFFGMGLGRLDGRIKVPLAGGGADYLRFSQGAVGSYRMGLEGRGDSWGVRYELMILNADSVQLSSNPYDYNGDGPNPTKIDYSGTLVRLSMFTQF